MASRAGSGVDSDTLMTLTREGPGAVDVSLSREVTPGESPGSNHLATVREGFLASVSDDPDGTRDSRCNSDLPAFIPAARRATRRGRDGD